MKVREEIVVEVWKRLKSITGVTSKRNPESPPRPDDLPAVNLFEMEEKHDQSMGREYPTSKNAFPLAVEVIIKGTSEAAVSGELTVLVDAVLKALYDAPKFLGKKAELDRTATTRPVTLPGGEHIKGIGIIFTARYSEDLANL